MFAPARARAGTLPLERELAEGDEGVRLVRRVVAGLRADAARVADLPPTTEDRALFEVRAAVVAALLDQPIVFASEIPPDTLDQALGRVSRATAEEVARRGASLGVAQVVRLWRELEHVRVALRDQAARRPLALTPRELRTVAEVVHDLRSPLGAVLLMSDVMQEQAAARHDGAGERQAQLVHGAAAAMHALVSDLRDLARGTASLLDAEPVVFSLADVMDRVVQLVAPLAEERKLALRVVLPTEVRVRGHPTALTRVVLNLVINGLCSSETGGVEVVAGLGESGETTITVRDSGRGLPAAIVERIDAGEAPLRVGPAAKNDIARGLGLSICVSLTRAMGGTLRVRETGAEGTVFELRTPSV